MRLKAPLLVLAVIACCATVARGNGAAVSGVRYWSAPDHTRIVIELSEEYQYRVSTRQDPERVVIDLPEVEFTCSRDPRLVDDHLVKQLRCNSLQSGAQVVVDLEGCFKFKYFALEELPGRKPRRVVVDIYPTPRHAAQGDEVQLQVPPAPPQTAVIEHPTPPESHPPAEPEPPMTQLHEVVVVIDPGHGGEDPGAIHEGVREKQITLDIAQRMRSRIDALPGYRAVLTRDGDYTVSLARRRELADRARGDLLISIHSNIAPNRNARGVEVYYLSTEGGSDRKAQALADLENSADLVGGVHPDASEEEVELVLGQQLEKSIGRSRKFANLAWRNARRNRTLKAQRQIKRAGFAVCKMVSMPAILVEVGFISNTHDRQLLINAEGRQSLADWLVGSVEDYFRKYPATLYDPLFARKEKLVYRVKQGDTLSRIAQRYRVSVDDLMRVNDLEHRNLLKTGELLLVVAAEEQPVVHRVKRGETLTSIASQYGVGLGNILDANRIQEADLLHPGEELIIMSVD